MPFLIPVAVAFAVGSAGAAAAGATIFGLTGLAADLVIGGIDAAVTLGSELLTTALTPKPKPPGQQLSVSLDPYQPRTVIVGMSATAGSLVTFQTWGDSNENIILVFALADHKCDSLAGAWWMGEPIQINADGSVVQGEYKGTPYLWVRFYPGDWNDEIDPTLLANSGGRWSPGAWGRGVCKVVVQAKFNENAHPQGLNGLFQFIWAVKGAHLYDRRGDSSVTGGNGPQRFDDQSTWVWSANGPLAIENFLRGFRVEDTSAPVGQRASDTFYGLALGDTDLPFAPNVAAFNVADETVAELNGGSELSGAANSNTSTITLVSAEGLAAGATVTIGLNLPDVEIIEVASISGLTVQLASKLQYAHADGEEVSWTNAAGSAPLVARYAIGGNLPCDADGETTLGNMLAACGDGRLLTGSGVDYVILPGVANTPLARPDGTAGPTITDADLRLDGPHKFQQYQQLDQVVNAVYGRWSDPTKYYTAVSLPPRLSPADEAEDGGRKEVTFDVTYCTDSSQGQRCQEIHRRRARAQMSAQLCLGPQYMCVEGGDWITWQSDRYGFEADFEVQNARWVLDDEKVFLGVVLDLQEIDSTVFDWDPDVDELSLTAPQTLPSADPPAANIAGFSVVAGSLADPVSGQQIPCLTFSWADVSDIYAVGVTVEWEIEGQPETASSTFSQTFPVDPTTAAPGGVTTVTVTQGVASALLYQARAIEVTVPVRLAEYTPWTPAQGVTPGTYVAVSAAVPWPGVTDPDSTRPANNATVGAQTDVNLSTSGGQPLGAVDVVTKLGTAANALAIGTAGQAAVEQAVAQASAAAANPNSDLSTPSTLAAPAISFATSLDATGGVLVTMTATASPASDANIAAYEFAVSLAGQAQPTLYEAIAPAVAFSTRVPAGVSYSVQVRQVKISGVRGSYSVAATGTTATNSTAPGAPSALSVSPGYQAVFASWTNPANTDLDHIEVWAGTSNSLSAASQVATVAVAPGAISSSIVSGLTLGSAEYVWVRAVNASALKSGFTGPQSATPVGVAATSVTGALAASQIAAVNPSTILAGALPSGVMVPAASISGTLTATQIASVNASVVSGQLAAVNIPGIDASKLISGTIPSAVSVPTSTLTGTIGSALISSLNPSTILAGALPSGVTLPAASVSGTLTATQIASVNASVVSGQLAAVNIPSLSALNGQLTSSQLSAGSVLASKLASGAAGNLVADPTFLDAAYWSPSSSAVLFGAANSGDSAFTQLGVARSIAFTSGGSSASTTISCVSSNIPIEPGKYYRLAGRFGIEGNFNGLVSLSVNFYTASGSYVTGQQILGTDYRQSPAAANAVNTIDSLVLAPALSVGASVNAATMAIIPQVIWGSSTPVGVAYFAGPIANRAIDAAFIVAGSITSNAIAANTITSQQIAAGTIVAANIAAGTITGTLIAAGTVSASNIVSGTLTSAQIAAGTIVGSNIAASTINGSNIAANTVAAANILANTITAGQIAANTITSQQIAAGTIVAANIAAGTITGTLIAAGTISGTNIVAGTITASLLQAGSITATQMNIGVSGNLIPNPNSETQGLPGAAGANIISYNNAYNGNYVRSLTNTQGSSGAAAAGLVDAPIPCAPGDILLITAWANSLSSAARGYVSGYFVSGSGNGVGAASVSVPAGMQFGCTSNTWTQVGYQLTAPSGVVGFVPTYAADTANGQVLFDALFCAKMTTGALIVNGTITGSNIAAGTVTGGLIAAGTITGNNIQAGTITASNIAAGTITGALIAAGTVTASNIAAGTITGTQVAANTITATNLSVSSLSALSANIGTVTAGLISSSNSATFFDLTNARVQLFNVAGYVTRAGNIASGVILWAGPPSVSVGSETGSNSTIFAATSSGVYIGGQLADAGPTHNQVLQFSNTGGSGTLAHGTSGENGGAGGSATVASASITVSKPGGVIQVTATANTSGGTPSVIVTLTCGSNSMQLLASTGTASSTLIPIPSGYSAASTISMQITNGSTASNMTYNGCVVSGVYIA